MDLTEWLTMIVATAGGAAALHGPVSTLRARRHLRCIDNRISCPRSAADVDCTLVRDGRTGTYVGVDYCSASGSGGRPTCDQDCIRILNRGIPLPPRESPLGHEEEPAESIG